MNTDLRAHFTLCKAYGKLSCTTLDWQLRFCFSNAKGDPGPRKANVRGYSTAYSLLLGPAVAARSWWWAPLKCSQSIPAAIRGRT